MQTFEAINRLFYQMSLSELRLMNEKMLYPHVTYNSLLYLDLITYYAPCTISSLAALLHISKPAVTMKVNELIRQGLVQKVQSEADRRVYYLSVRPEIRAEYARMDDATRYAVEKLEQAYTQQEMALFCRMMQDFDGAYVEGSQIDQPAGTHI